MDINSFVKIEDGNCLLPKNKVCLVWCHARWFIAIEGEKDGMTFEVKPSEKTAIMHYTVGFWGYTTVYKTFTKRQGGKDAALEWMKGEITA